MTNKHAFLFCGVVIMMIIASGLFVPFGIKHDWPVWIIIADILLAGFVFGLSLWNVDPNNAKLKMDKIPTKLMLLYALSYLLLLFGTTLILFVQESYWLYAIGVIMYLSCGFIQKYFHSVNNKL